MAGKRLRVNARPYPLVGVITPWNGPLANQLLDVPAALMAGCAVLTKPSEVTPASADSLWAWLERAGLPAASSPVNRLKKRSPPSHRCAIADCS